MCRLRSVSGTGSLSVRSMQLQKPTVTHPLDGYCNRALRWAVEHVPAVYHMEGSAIGAQGVQLRFQIGLWLGWLLQTCEVQSAERQSTDRQIEPDQPMGCMLQSFFFPPTPTLYKVQLVALEGGGRMFGTVLV